MRVSELPLIKIQSISSMLQHYPESWTNFARELGKKTYILRRFPRNHDVLLQKIQFTMFSFKTQLIVSSLNDVLLKNAIHDVLVQSADNVVFQVTTAPRSPRSKLAQFSVDVRLQTSSWQNGRRTRVRRLKPSVKSSPSSTAKTSSRCCIATLAPCSAHTDQGTTHFRTLATACARRTDVASCSQAPCTTSHNIACSRRPWRTTCNNNNSSEITTRNLRHRPAIPTNPPTSSTRSPLKRKPRT